MTKAVVHIDLALREYAVYGICISTGNDAVSPGFAVADA